MLHQHLQSLLVLHTQSDQRVLSSLLDRCLFQCFEAGGTGRFRRTSTLGSFSFRVPQIDLMEKVRQGVIPAIFAVFVLGHLVEPFLVHVEGDVPLLAEVGESLKGLFALESLAEPAWVLGHAELLLGQSVRFALAHGERVEQDVAGLEERVGRLVLHIEEAGCLLAVRVVVLVLAVLELASGAAAYYLLLEHGRKVHADGAPSDDTSCCVVTSGTCKSLITPKRTVVVVWLPASRRIEGGPRPVDLLQVLAIHLSVRRAGTNGLLLLVGDARVHPVLEALEVAVVLALADLVLDVAARDQDSRLV